jgi:hypothetical protein
MFRKKWLKPQRKKEQRATSKLTLFTFIKKTGFRKEPVFFILMLQITLTKENNEMTIRRMRLF